MKNNGERFVPTDAVFNDVIVNLERYLFAIHHCKDKIVIDAGCGCGLGTYLYSLVAKEVFAIDYNKDALKYAKQFPLEKRKVHFLKRDLNKDLLPQGDVCVATEVIEHLENPDFFLSQIKCPEIVFSIPLNAMAVSTWHKQDIKTLDDIKELMERYYKVPEYFNQYNHWIYGKGTKL